MQYGSLVSDALSKTARLIPLALVPLVASLARWPDVLAVATEPGVNFGVKFGLPHPLADLWTFIDAPSPEGGGFYVDAPFVDPSVAREGELLADPQVLGAIVLTLAGYVLFTGVLTAGYLGSINQFLTARRYDFLANVRRYAVRMVALQTVLLGSFLLVFGAALVAVPLVILLVAVGFVAWLLLYLTPFLVVVADEPLLVAFRRSLRLTTSSVQPLAFVVVYALLVAAISLPMSALANLGIGGVLAAAALASNFGLFLSVLAVMFTRELLAAGGDVAPSKGDTPATGAA